MSAFLNDYTLLDEIGHGAFASVYKVKHNTLGYIRAIRVLNQVIAKGEEDPLWQKFLNECKILLRLGNGNNPHIVRIHQPLLRDSKALVEMDYIDGMDLHTYLDSKDRYIEADEVLRLAREIGSALSFCHYDIYLSCASREEDNLEDDPEDGSRVLIDDAKRAELVKKYQVIHNDLHSGNIMRHNNGGGYVLLDFGLSIQDGDVLHSSRMKGGAPEYKAPEKWENEGTITCQSDIYSFGVILYEFLTGHVPFRYDTKNPSQTDAEYRLMQAVKFQAPPSIYAARKALFEASHPGQQYQRDYPDWMDVLIMKCLEKQPSQRFANGHELQEFINTYSNTNLNTNSENSLRAAKLEMMKQQLAQRLQKQVAATTQPPIATPLPPTPSGVTPPPRRGVPVRPIPVPPKPIPPVPVPGHQGPKPKESSSNSVLISLFVLVLVLGVVAAIIYYGYNKRSTKNQVSSTTSEKIIEATPQTLVEKPSKATKPEIVEKPVAKPVEEHPQKDLGLTEDEIKELNEIANQLEEYLGADADTVN